MKNHVRSLLFAAALASSALGLTSCAHVAPVINTVVTCSGQTIPTALVDEVYTDIMTENWGDLATVAVPALADGWNDVVCIYDALKAGNPGLTPHFEKLKAGHVELRGASACRAPTLEKVSTNFQKPTGEAMPARAGMTGDGPPSLLIRVRDGRSAPARGECRWPRLCCSCPP